MQAISSVALPVAEALKRDNTIDIYLSRRTGGKSNAISQHTTSLDDSEQVAKYGKDAYMVICVTK